ncbi:MAG: hypothetical protein K2N09_08895 [Muribaculaceae bacterium]|nr:hypothetical protein [Muribaculaceae bacterium]
MNDDQKIEKLLGKIRDCDPIAFERFSLEHPICFHPKKGNWMFPMMFDFYLNHVRNCQINEYLKELGLILHESCQNDPLFEITKIDKSLCIDDSYVEDYARKVQNAHNNEPKFQDIKSPWKTRGITLSLYEIPSVLLNSIIFEFKDKEHPYILADIAGMYVYSQKIFEALGYLYRSVNLLTKFPNRFWNSEYGLAGAANTFRLLLLMSSIELMDTYRKVFSYDYMFLTKLACTATDELFQHEAYVNRASIVLSPLARYVIPLHINPELLYISDTYFAHYCNELAEKISFASGWNYNMKSLTYYQHGSIRPNDTGGFVDIEDRTYFQIVSEKHKQAKEIAFSFFSDISSGKGALQKDEVETLFRYIQHECRYNYKSLRDKILNYKSYK